MYISFIIIVLTKIKLLIFNVAYVIHHAHVNIFIMSKQYKSTCHYLDQDLINSHHEIIPQLTVCMLHTP